MEDNQSKTGLYITIGVVAIVLVVVIVMLINQSDSDDATKTANENNTTQVAEANTQPAPAPQSTNNVPENPEAVVINPNDAVDDEQATPGTLPANWSQLSLEAQIGLNPYNCDLDTQYMRGDNGQCLPKVSDTSVSDTPVVYVPEVVYEAEPADDEMLPFDDDDVEVSPLPPVLPTSNDCFKANQEWRNDQGQLHRDGDRPAVVKCYENGQVEYEAWYQNGQRHRDGDRPAVIEYYDHGQVEYEAWYQNGVLIKDEGSMERVF